MRESESSWFSIITRMIFAMVLLLLSYNPEGYSYYHWGILHVASDMPAKVFAGVVLLIAWAMYIRSAGDTFGYMGTFLTGSFFATLLWVVVNNNWLSPLGERVLIYGVLFCVSWIIATGFSFSFLSNKDNNSISTRGNGKR